MKDAILERRLETPKTVEGLIGSLEEVTECLDIHRVEWQQTMISSNGLNLVCWFRGIDLESARMALRMAEVDTRVLWSATVHEAPGLDASELDSVNVLVKREFEEPVQLDDVQAIEDAGSECLEMRNVKFVRTFYSTDRKRMICLYQAPDAESVRQAQHEAGLPFDDVWAFDILRP